MTGLVRDYWPALAVLAGFAVLRWVILPLIARRVDGPNAPIVVVDRRTYRIALVRINRAAAVGNLNRAYAGHLSLCMWLRGEIGSGPKRRRVEYAHALDMAELRAEQAGYDSLAAITEGAS